MVRSASENLNKRVDVETGETLTGYSHSSVPTFEEPTMIENGDWALFSAAIGLKYFFAKYVGLQLNLHLGTYPIRGPGEEREGRVEATGPPDTWGTYHKIIGGLQFRF
jgi:hypothetical protein